MNSNIIFEVFGCNDNPTLSLCADKNLLINAGYSDHQTLLMHDSCVFALMRIRNAAIGMECKDEEKICDFVAQAAGFCLLHKNGKPIFDVLMRTWVG